MRIVLSVVGVLGSLSVPARAEPVAVPVAATASTLTSVPAATEAPPARFAVALNAPPGWLIGSLGGSAYVRIGDHVALRGNLATYQNSPPGGILSVLSDVGAAYGGRVLDVGVAAVWYPRRVWDGFLLEVGVLRRERDVYVWPELDDRTFIRSTEYAGRALIGWSWLIGQRAFIAIAAGYSVGHESGESTTTPEFGSMTPITKAVRLTQKEREGYIRVGLVFGD
jgi:hypothetical protein